MTDSNNSGRRRGSIGCLVVLALGLASLSMLGLVVAMGFSGEGGGGSIVETLVDAPQNAQRKLAIIEVRGVLLGGTADGSVTGTALKMLTRARDDDQVAGVLLSLDTPGGGVTDADLLHDAVGRLRSKGKKVLVLMGDLCASGGVYAAVAAEKIWAHPTTVTGSIGVIMHSLDLHRLLEEHGVVDRSIISGPNKALLSPTRPQTPAQRAILQSVVDNMHTRFKALVAEGRGLSAEAVDIFADGRVFTADLAKANGLIDDIGYERDALEGLKHLAGGGRFIVTRYSRIPSLFERLGVRAQGGSAMERFAVELARGPRAMYLFAPYAPR